MCVSPNDLQCSYVAPSGLWSLVGPLVRRGKPLRCFVSPLRIGVRYIICEDSQISAEHSALVKLSACKVTTFFLNMQILLGQIAFFAVFLWFCGK